VRQRSRRGQYPIIGRHPGRRFMPMRRRFIGPIGPIIAGRQRRSNLAFHPSLVANPCSAGDGERRVDLAIFNMTARLHLMDGTQHKQLVDWDVRVKLSLLAGPILSARSGSAQAA